MEEFMKVKKWEEEMIQIINCIILFYLLVLEAIKLWENWKKKRFFRNMAKTMNIQEKGIAEYVLGKDRRERIENAD